MSWIRFAVRGTLLALWSTLVHFVWLAVHLALALAPAARRRWRRVVFRAWGRVVCPILGVRLEVHGEPPPRPFFLVCNHLSYLDIPLLASRLGARFVSKADVADWPVVGRLARSMGTIFVERERKRRLLGVNDELERALAEGEGVVLFPEGTSTRGDEVRRFRPSLLEPAARGAHPVHCASLSYGTGPGDPPASLAVCWWGGMEFVPHVCALLRLSRIEARIDFAPETVRDPDRKLLAEKSWLEVREHFRPVA